ncbi:MULTISPECIES: TnsA-like heteromeric transposase endonuclease subunit [Streptomyces]|uniref:TnsA-like heteromeric transposase endonuclease subunit n=1 Tax=Streptomyces TaxID=1883 RepID=UPI0027BA90DB|nr:TnsA-like heteromeric transposase endonuclease subunit [Streptomyces sp. HG99]
MAFEEVAPVRREFPSHRGQRNFPGLYWAATMLRHVGFESWLERDHAISMDFDPRATWFASQPFWLFWTSAEGMRLSHAPDYFARRADGSAVVVDCLPEARRRKPRDLAKFAGTQTACEAVGWDFRSQPPPPPPTRPDRTVDGETRRATVGSPLAPGRSRVAVPGPLVGQAAQVGDPWSCRSSFICCGAGG